ncbi:C39 family peptidase [Bacillus sp. 1NLA3E]|uniref:C39 family peptidase n=1 Tax=Bacillus sp. 1NLA3E TaxID=666686 RepID=UPI000247F135|nr:C39 family peptidase [Bacillus sp. 1NLA3E]AGK55548.1 hypothetical protein B1NLA3E_19020 [Bacillus sp. 1NLA3E]
MIKICKLSIAVIILGCGILIGSSFIPFADKSLSTIKSSKDSNQTIPETTPKLVENVDLEGYVASEKQTEPETVVNEVLLDVPLLNQMDSPRLYNGCEVTSLAMILNFKGIQVTKNELAQEIARVPLKYSNGNYGNPNFGFVGNMENGPGLGVFHGPIFDLANKYDHGNVEDLTNQPFDLILKKLAQGNPIWVITTTTFAPISGLQTWQTPQGSVDITFKMHSVVITGYDPENIYINNPYGNKNQKVNRENFIESWEQMGKQAIVIY